MVRNYNFGWLAKFQVGGFEILSWFLKRYDETRFLSEKTEKKKNGELIDWELMSGHKKYNLLWHETSQIMQITK